jgi:hypothetical protein
MAARKPPIEFVAYEEEVNLLTVSWNQRFLEQVKKEYGLKHGQAVVYRNVARDRWRLVACFYGLAVLILPPVDKEARLSLDLEVSRFLKKMSGNFDQGMRLLEEEIRYNEERKVNVEMRNKKQKRGRKK